MQIPYRLRRRQKFELNFNGPFGWLLFAADMRQIAQLIGSFPTGSGSAVYRLTDGFIITANSLPDTPFTSTLRLRAYAEHVWLPVDADLIPALLPDELKGIRQQLGLVFLPGQVLTYASDQPLTLTQIIHTGSIRRGNWTKFPAEPVLTPRVFHLKRELPVGQMPEAVLESGREGIGESPPQSPPSNIARNVLGRASLGFGRGLSWLGHSLNISGLRSLGRSLIRAALNAAPQLSRSILGQQEAALRDLLNQFRNGNIDEALRRALPLSGENEESSRYLGSSLPTHNTTYSLDSLLSGGGRGLSSTWLTAEEVQRELAREYRVAAQVALGQGDFRRAAFIYGRLLGDFREAAAALLRGGLYHDAAILLRDKVGDILAAAAAFEAAGEFDEAVSLYRRQKEHQRAGDLLSRLGESEAALAEFTLAADLLAEKGNHLAAGDLMTTKTGQLDLAVAYYKAGWAARSCGMISGNALPCALRLGKLYASSSQLELFLGLFQEGERFFQPDEHETAAGEFFNHFLRLAHQYMTPEVTRDLRDRCLIQLSRKLRSYSSYETRVNSVVQAILGDSGNWHPALLSDARHALAIRLKVSPSSSSAGRPIRRFSVGTGRVTAVAGSSLSRDIFVGFADGRVVCLRGDNREVVTVRAAAGEPISALSVKNDGTLVVAFERIARDIYARVYRRYSDYHYTYHRSGQVSHLGILTEIPPLLGAEELIVYNSEIPAQVIFNSDEADSSAIRARSVSQPLPLNLYTLDRHIVSLTLNEQMTPDSNVYLILPMPEANECLVWWQHGVAVATLRSNIRRGRSLRLRWQPSQAAELSILASPTAWLAPEILRVSADVPPSRVHRVELAGVTSEGVLHWSGLRIENAQIIEDATCHRLSNEGFRAVAIMKPGMVVTLTSTNRLQWLRAGRREFASLPTTTNLDRDVLPAGLFAHPMKREVTVIFVDGSAATVTSPF